MFAALSVFRGGFDAEAAKKVAGANAFHLANMIERRLLSIEERENGNRYYIHELMRQYAAEKLASDPEVNARALRNHSLYFAAMTDEQEHALRQGAKPDKMLAEMDNIHAGWTHALQEVIVEALNGYHMGIAIFYWLQGWFVESVETFERATQILLSYDDRPEVQKLIVYFQVACGAHSQFMGMIEQGKKHLDKAMLYADRLGEPEMRVIVLDRQSRMANERSDFNAGIDLGLQAHDIYVALGDETNAMRTIVQIGAANYYRQEYSQAKEHLERSVAYFRSNQLPSETIIALGYLAMVQIKLGDYSIARANLEQIANLAAQMDTPMHTSPLNSLGRVSVAQGELAAARGYFEESVRYCLDHHIMSRWAVAIGLLGDLDRLEGRLDESSYRLNESLTILKESNLDRQVARMTHMLGLLEESKGDYDRAVRHYSDCLTIYERLENYEGVSMARVGLSSVARRRGEYESARHELNKALELAVDIGAAPLILDVIDHWARLYRRFDRAEEAYSLLAFVCAQPQTRFETRQEGQEVMRSLMRSHGITATLRKRATHFTLDEILAQYFSIPSKA
jgi:tetratricopeptide (TPR) repeat protein